MKETEVGSHPVWQIQGSRTTEDEIDETGYTKVRRLRAQGQRRRDPRGELGEEGQADSSTST